jgi:hypothetical protein
LKFSSEFRSASSLRHLRDFTEIQENELPDKFIALVIREDEFDERFPAIAAKRRAATKR